MFRVFLASLAALLLLAGLAIGVFAIGRTHEAAATGVGTSASPESVFPERQKVPGILSEYTLDERSGRKFHSKELDGRVHVVNFFFSTCPTVCRMQTAAVKGLAEEFGPKGVVFISITCDPDVDTPAKLAQYANEFAADPKQWLFLTGDLQDLRRVGAEMYYVAVDRQTHSESLLVVDGAGKIRGRFGWKDAKQVADMKKVLTDLVAETKS